jgi:hypothetical protein
MSEDEVQPLQDPDSLLGPFVLWQASCLVQALALEDLRDEVGQMLAKVLTK